VTRFAADAAACAGHDRFSGNARLTVLPFVIQQGFCAGGAQPPCQALSGLLPPVRVGVAGGAGEIGEVIDAGLVLRRPLVAIPQVTASASLQREPGQAWFASVNWRDGSSRRVLLQRSCRRRPNWPSCCRWHRRTDRWPSGVWAGGLATASAGRRRAGPSGYVLFMEATVNVEGFSRHSVAGATFPAAGAPGCREHPWRSCNWRGR
jgi:hypothetical protein